MHVFGQIEDVFFLWFFLLLTGLRVPAAATSVLASPTSSTATTTPSEMSSLGHFVDNADDDVLLDNAWV